MKTIKPKIMDTLMDALIIWMLTVIQSIGITLMIRYAFDLTFSFKLIVKVFLAWSLLKYILSNISKE